MARIYHKKNDEKEQTPDTLGWYDLLRDRWLNTAPSTQIVTEVDIPETGETLTVIDNLNP